MSDGGEVLNVDQLMELIELSASPDNPNRDEIDQKILDWVQDPSSIPTSFEIIQSMKSPQYEKLRFYAAKCLQYFIKSEITSFSEENIQDMTNLFGKFIMDNQNRINSYDTMKILISLADLCAFYIEIIEEIINLFPPYLFLILIGMLTEEMEDPNFKSLNSQLDDCINQLKDTIYQYFADTPFTIQWSQSFSRIFKYYKETVNCLPFLDKIEMMTQDENYFTSFLDILTQSFELDFEDDEPTFDFNTQIIQIAVPFALNNPEYAVYVWKTIFSYFPIFFFSEDRIDFTNSVVESFIDSVPSLCDDKELTYLIEIVSKDFLSVNDELLEYPDELRLKYIYGFIELLIDAYNEKGNLILKQCLNASLNSFVNSIYIDQVKEFLISQPITPALLLICSTQLFVNDEEFFSKVLEFVFQLPEFPIEAFHFIKSKVIFLPIIKPYIQQLIQVCLDLLDSSFEDSINALRMIAKYHKDEISPYTSDLTLTFLPELPNFSIKHQRLVILMFLFIYTEDDANSLESIKDLILRNVSTAISSSDIDEVMNILTFLLELYQGFSINDCDQFIVDFMIELFPTVFHELEPILSIEDIIIQEKLGSFVYQVSTSKCVFIPEEAQDDDEQRHQFLFEGDMYGDVFQWLLTIMDQYICKVHFSILTSYKIKPFPELLDIIFKIEPNDNHEVIEELFLYIQFISKNGNSTVLCPLIPYEFLISFLSSSHYSVVSSTLQLIGKLNNIFIQIKSSIFEEIISKSITKLWAENNSITYSLLRTLAALTHKDDESFNTYVELMISFFENVSPEDPYFQMLKVVSDKESYNIINSDLIKVSRSLLNIINAYVDL